MRSIFTGLSAFPLTPADADGVVDTDALGALLVRLEEAGVASIGLLAARAPTPTWTAISAVAPSLPRRSAFGGACP